MNPSFQFATLQIPARIADLAFHLSVPHDWNPIDLPAEDPDFTAPATFFPLLLVAAPWAMVVLTVGARPAFDDGTLQDWSLFLLDSQGIRATALAPVTIGTLRGLAGVGRQQQDATWLEVRFAFFEDGGRLVYLGMMAPEAISGPLDPVWKTALASFALDHPRGQNTPVGPGLGILSEAASDAEPEQVPLPSTGAPAPEASDAPTPPAPEPAQFSEEDFGHYAKSGDLSTLDPEHPVNARLRDQGVGFTPNLLEADEPARTAKLGVAAIAATIRVAFGWHVIDDGRRTMILDPDGRIQISLNLISTDGRTTDQLLDEIEAEAAQSYANPEFLRLADGGITALAIRGIVVNDEPVEQIHMLTPWAKDSAILRARVTADPDSMRYAANYADLILKSADYGHQHEHTVVPTA